MKYRIEWEVMVSDGFDDAESVGRMDPITVEADSPAEAGPLIQAAIGQAIHTCWPDQSHGSFTQHILSITDENGECIVSSPPWKIVNNGTNFLEE